MIKFRCPNGHPLAASESRVGKSGQCPRCQAQFVVPPPHPESDDVQTRAARGDDEPHLPSPSGNASPASGPACETFMFLCPNGHKLYGLPALQGRPGQCPHCHSRFLIPAAQAEPADAAPAEDDSHGLAETPTADIVWDLWADDQDAQDDEAIRSGLADNHELPPPPPVPVSCHPLAHILRRIWTGRRTAEPLQLQLADGTTLRADSLSVELSQHEYGVFAVRSDDDAWHIVVLPWDQIIRATLPHTPELPADLGRGTRPM